MDQPLVMNGIDIDALVKESHETAKEKGWWEEGVANRSVYDQIANFHAEVSEAWECYRAGQMETVCAHNTGKPEGFWVEVADVMIRIADTVGAYRIKLPGAAKQTVTRTVGQFICEVHYWLTCIKPTESHGEQAMRTTGGILSFALKTCTEYAVQCNELETLKEALRLKLAYNKTRPHRHGNKLA